MSSEQKNNIKFVQEVEKYPCLYDYRLMEYARKDVTEKAWNNVGKVINLTGSQSKEKWKNLRTVFSRNLKPSPGSSKRVKKPYYLAQTMQFAIPFIKTQTSTVSGNFRIQNQPKNTAENTYDIENDRDAQESIDQINSPQKSSRMPTPSSPPPSPQTCLSPAQTPQTFSAASMTNKRSRKSNDLTETDENSLEYLKSKWENIENTDPTKISKKMFLLSLLSDLYSMNDAQMRTFRIKVVTLIDDILRTPNSSQPFSTIAQPSSSGSHFCPMPQQVTEENYMRSHIKEDLD